MRRLASVSRLVVGCVALLATMPAAASVERCMPPLPGASTATRHRVFAHYFSPFPVSLDNADPTIDTYARAMTPAGDGGRFRAVGGYLRERPLPRPPRAGADWRRRDVADEVRRAAAIGIDGFAFDMLHTSGPNADRLHDLLAVIPAVAPQFRILLMPDMNAEFGEHAERLVPAVTALASDAAIARDERGRVIVAPFNAAVRDPAWWEEQVRALGARGVPVMFVPVFLDWKHSAPDYLAVSDGLSWWGPRTPDRAGRLAEDARAARAAGKLWMAPVAPQDFRPKSRFFFEAGGSELFRRMWEGAIAGGADWVHIITWNDYSEATEIAPSSGIGHVFYDLSAYYLAWFKSGTPPRIPRDILYYFHRTQRAVPVRAGTQQEAPIVARGSETPRDDVEVLALLRAPGEIELGVGSVVRRQMVPAGLTSVRVPLAAGRPHFTLRRDGRVVLSGESDWAITDDYPYQDLLYRAGCVTDAQEPPR